MTRPYTHHTDEKHFSFECRCGSRRTARYGSTGLVRTCVDCGRMFFWRVQSSGFLPFSKATAQALDERRAG